MRAVEDFEEFARARIPQLYRTAWLLAGDRHHAEDLVQETLANLLRTWHRIESPAAYARTALVRTFVFAAAAEELVRTAHCRSAGAG